MIYTYTNLIYKSDFMLERMKNSVETYMTIHTNDFFKAIVSFCLFSLSYIFSYEYMINPSSGGTALNPFIVGINVISLFGLIIAPLLYLIFGFSNRSKHTND